MWECFLCLYAYWLCLCAIASQKWIFRPGCFAIAGTPDYGCITFRIQKENCKVKASRVWVTGRNSQHTPINKTNNTTNQQLRKRNNLCVNLWVFWARSIHNTWQEYLNASNLNMFWIKSSCYNYEELEKEIWKKNNALCTRQQNDKPRRSTEHIKCMNKQNKKEADYTGCFPIENPSNRWWFLALKLINTFENTFAEMVQSYENYHQIY